MERTVGRQMGFPVCAYVDAVTAVAIVVLDAAAVAAVSVHAVECLLGQVVGGWYRCPCCLAVGVLRDRRWVGVVEGVEGGKGC